MSAELQLELRDVLATKRVAVVVGAGVSMAAAGLPGWSKAIESGLEYARVAGVLDGDGVSRGLNALRDQRFPEAAQILKDALGAPAGEYPRWLEKTFGIGRDRVVDHALVDAVVDLPYAALASALSRRQLPQYISAAPAVRSRMRMVAQGILSDVRDL